MLKKFTQDGIRSYVESIFKKFTEKGDKIKEIFIGIEDWILFADCFDAATDPCTRKELIENGCLGMIWGATIHVGNNRLIVFKGDIITHSWIIEPRLSKYEWMIL